MTAVKDVKLSILGRAFGPDGGTRSPYTLFTGVVSLKYLTTATLPVWWGESRQFEPVKIYGLIMDGTIRAYGDSHEFQYAALSNCEGKTLRRCGDPEYETDTYRHDNILMPVGSNYPYPKIHGWQDWEKAITASSPDPAGDWYGRPQVPPETEVWQAPWEHIGPRFFARPVGQGFKVTSSLSLDLPGLQSWCKENLLTK